MTPLHHRAATLRQANVLKYVEAEFEAHGGGARKSGKLADWEVVYRTDIPLQTNVVDCGVHCVMGIIFHIACNIAKVSLS